MLTIGQKLWCVTESRHMKNYEVDVVKVGRKWAYLKNNFRIDVNTLEIDGGVYASPGKCYLSKADYDAEKELNIEWCSLMREVENLYRAPHGMTLDKIGQIRNILKGVV